MGATASFVADAKTGSPHFKLTTTDVESTPDELIHGIPEFQLPSHLRWYMKKILANFILKEASKMSGQTVFDMDLPFLSGVDLEKNTTFDYSQEGQVSLLLNI